MKQAWVMTAVGVAALAVAAALGAVRANAGAHGVDDARAVLYDAAANRIGQAKLEQKDDVVKLKVAIDDSALSAGFHGFHVHAKGECIAPFTSALGHFNPGGASHGDHAGDLPVLYIGADGTGEARLATDRFALDDLFDADGSALIVHAGRDNYANIPTDRYDPDPDGTTLGTGDAGARAACGIIEGE